MIRFLLNIICMLMFLNITFANNKGEFKMKKPYMSVAINISGCTYKILVNDVPVMSDPDGLPVEVTIPVNEWMRSGKNTLSMELGPVKDSLDLEKIHQNCKASTTLLMRSNEQATEDNIAISKLVYDSNPVVFNKLETSYSFSTRPGHYTIDDKMIQSNQNGYIIQEPIKIQFIKQNFGQGINLSRTIIIPLNLPEWAWFNSDIIQANEQTKRELLNRYEMIWNALKAKNLEPIKNDFNLRDNELSEAYYTKNNAGQTVKALLTADNNHKLILQKIYPKYAKLEVFGNNHLAKLVTWDGGSLIFYNYKDDSASSNFDITFMKKNNQWIIIR